MLEKSNLSLLSSFRSRPTTPCSTCEKAADGGVGSGYQRYDEECDDCRLAETEVGIANGGDNGGTSPCRENAYEDDSETHEKGSISIGIKSWLPWEGMCVVWAR